MFSQGAYSLCNQYHTGPIIDAYGILDDGSLAQQYSGSLDCQRAIAVPHGQIELIFTIVQLAVGDGVNLGARRGTRRGLRPT